MVEFYLGTHRPHWAWNGRAAGPLFISARQLARRRSAFPRATVPVCLDSGGFTELAKHGEWRTSPDAYVELVARAEAQLKIGWAAVQDWMCEPSMLARTGLTVEEHQRRTIASFLRLRELAPSTQWLPVIQGWTEEDYVRHVACYADAGVDLTALERVGVGSICRRGSTAQIVSIVVRLARHGLRLHAFGVKARALREMAPWVCSADSTAWSSRGRSVTLRMNVTDYEGRNLANSQPWAEVWRLRMLEDVRAGMAGVARPSMGGGRGQLTLWDAMPGGHRQPR
jgi:hypothetical protein